MPKQKLANGELADLIEKIAYRVEMRDKTLGHDSSVSLALEELLRRDNLDGVGLLNRIALLSMKEGRATKARYAFIAKIVEQTKPLNPIEDSKALRVLALQIRV